MILFKAFPLPHLSVKCPTFWKWSRKGQWVRVARHKRGERTAPKEEKPQHCDRHSHSHWHPRRSRSRHRVAQRITELSHTSYTLTSHHSSYSTFTSNGLWQHGAKSGTLLIFALGQLVGLFCEKASKGLFTRPFQEVQILDEIWRGNSREGGRDKEKGP